MLEVTKVQYILPENFPYTVFDETGIHDVTQNMNNLTFEQEYKQIGMTAANISAISIPDDFTNVEYLTMSISVRNRMYSQPGGNSTAFDFYPCHSMTMLLMCKYDDKYGLTPLFYHPNTSSSERFTMDDLMISLGT